MIRPILFNTPMVRAIRNDLKTATRRLIIPKYRDDECSFQIVSNAFTGKFIRVEILDDNDFATRNLLPQYSPGDILWVREAWSMATDLPGVSEAGPVYRADYADWELRELRKKHFHWKPSIHMPAALAREFLLVTDVRAEQLHEMKEVDYIKEGIRLKASESECRCAWEEPGCRLQPCSNRDAYDQVKYMHKFAALWDGTVPDEKLSNYGFSANPWVWVTEFKRCAKPANWLAGTEGDNV